MKCPHLIKWVIESCKADCKPYVPSLSELKGYCNNEAYRKCSFYQGDPVGMDSTRECVTV